MAHSLQTYRGKTEVLNDLDLLIILGFALEVIRESSQFESLQSLAMAWQQVPKMYGPGVIDLKIDELIQTHTEVRELRKLLETVLQKASKYHETIPAPVLKKIVMVPGIRFNDYKVGWVNEAVKKLQTLIAQP